MSYTVKLSKMPSPKTVSASVISGMWGGLNIRSDPTEVQANQSPDMLNMWYREGMLRKRYGQKRIVSGENRSALGRVWFYDKLFNGKVLYLDGNVFKYFSPGSPSTLKQVLSITVSDTTHGTFFAFGENVYYKSDTDYIRFSYSSSYNGTITGEYIIQNKSVASGKTYRPIIAINRKPDGSGGDLYQPENRINPEKEIWFDIDETSREYYLPYHGCNVLSVEINGQKVTTSGTASSHRGPFKQSQDGIVFDIYDENLTDDKPGYTYLKFRTPIYIDESGWSERDYRNTPSTGWNYFNNVVYSGVNVEIPNEGVLAGGKTMKPKSNSVDLPVIFDADLFERAKAYCPYSVDKGFFVFDNGEWMNVFFVGPAGADKVVREYRLPSTELIMTNYFVVSYRYATQTWSTKDYTKTVDTGWHYANNCTYSSVDITFNGQTIIHDCSEGAPSSGYPTAAKINGARSKMGLLNYAKSQLPSAYQNAELLWIAENENIWVFHYKRPDQDFYITEYDEATGMFKARGYVKVTIEKINLKATATDEINPAWGSYVKNIIYANRALVYYKGLTDIHTALRQTGNVTEYESVIETARRRAMKNGLGVTESTPAIVAKSGQYTSVYFVPDTMTLTSYNPDTTEFKAKGWVFEKYDSTLDMSVNLSLSTPADKSNRVRVVVRKENPDAQNAIVSCSYATAYGGTDAVCVVLGGCEKQPNAIFWSGNGTAGVDPTYFPMDQFNLCGTYQDPVVGFGKQQSYLVIFQEHHISKARYGITTINGRNNIDLTLSTINSERGCDQPWTIRLAGNNLVWVHSRYGVMYLKDASSAYENMVVVISKNVNGTIQTGGLLSLLNGVSICNAEDDGERYYLFVDGLLYIWDHSLSGVADGVGNLSWTLHDGFQNRESALTVDGGNLLTIDTGGSIYEMSETETTDNGQPIPCHYKSPTQIFGGYYALKNIREIILTVVSKNGGNIKVSVGSERTARYADEIGHTKSVLGERTIAKREFHTPLIFKPRNINIHHLWLLVESDGNDGGIGISDATILYTSMERTR